MRLIRVSVEVAQVLSSLHCFGALAGAQLPVDRAGGCLTMCTESESSRLMSTSVLPFGNQRENIARSGRDNRVAGELSPFGRGQIET